MTGLFVPSSLDSGRGPHLADLVIVDVAVKHANVQEDRGYRENLAHIRELRPESELGTYERVKARFWPYLSG